MKKTYVFQDVIIQLFDIYLLPELMLAPKKSLKSQDYNFLTLKGRYDRQQESGGLLKSEHFVFQQFPPRKLFESDLWNRYKNTFYPENTSLWDTQIPFYLRLRQHELALDVLKVGDSIQTKIDSYVYLNALGWSTHIDIRLQGEITLAKLAKVTAALRDKPLNARVYNLNGKNYTLKEFFKYYKDLLIEDYFKPNIVPVRPDNFWNLIFIDVVQATGDEVSLDAMDDIDLRGFLDVLLLNPERKNIRYSYDGNFRKIIVDELSLVDVSGDYVNFGLMDFDVGAFNFIQHEALQSEVPTKIICYGQNVSAYFWILYNWMYYYKYVSGNRLKNKRINRLLRRGAVAVSTIGKEFHNRTAQSLYNNHSKITDFIQAYAFELTAGE